MYLSLMKIVVLDGAMVNPGDNPWDEVAALGALDVYPRTAPPLTVERAAPADILLTNKTALTEHIISRLPRLKLICVLATGYNVIDTAAARLRSVPVCNVPEYSTDSVAQHVFALLLELAGRICLYDKAVKDGEWSAGLDFSLCKSPPVELSGKTMGIVGFGRIGRRVGEIAHAMGMDVIASSRSRGASPGYSPFGWVSTEELFRRADVVSLNCALTRENAWFVNADLLSTMKPGAFIINTARGGLIAEDDLARALSRGAIAGAGLDVAAEEPIPAGNPLLSAPNCVMTPHIAWASLESRRRLMHETAANIAAFLSGKPRNVVN
jgi:glycerate dehydrogenase